MGSAFDKVAKKGSTTTKEIIAATVNTTIKKAVDLVITTKAEIKRLEAEQKENEQVIIDHVLPQRDKLARKGQFTKSLLVEGSKNKSLKCIWADKFSVPQDKESLKVLNEIGAQELIEENRSISVKSSVLKDEKALNKLAKAVEKAGLDISDFFDVIDKTQAIKNLDEKQYELDDEKLGVFRTIIRQAKPSLR